MIRVEKDFKNPPVGLLTDACELHRRKALDEKNEHKFSGYHYRGGSIEVLKAIYKNKCAYCETNESAGATLRVDHYRPKGRVEHVPGHQGYYWLAYEWSNLLLCCEKCNGRKLDNFPLQDEANRVLQPTLAADGTLIADCCRADKAHLQAERPLLLNPELDVPDQHLTFLPNGLIEAKTTAGEASIRFYFLKRDKLITDRKKMTDIVVDDLRKHLLCYLKKEIDKETYRYVMQDVYDKAALRCSADKSYSRVANALFDNFETFVVAQFPASQQEYIRQSFALYQKGRLWPIPNKS